MTKSSKILLTMLTILCSVSLLTSPALARTHAHASHASHVTHNSMHKAENHADTHSSHSNVGHEKTTTVNHTFAKHNLRQSLQRAYHKQYVITNPALWASMAHHNRLTDSHVKNVDYLQGYKLGYQMAKQDVKQHTRIHQNLTSKRESSHNNNWQNGYYAGYSDGASRFK